jgi:hypothetical protein
MRLVSILPCVALLLALAAPAGALPLFTFTTPDAPIPPYSGNGLDAELWAGVNVDTLAAARAHVLGFVPTTTFVSTSVDYPNGAAGSTTTSSTFGAALGVDAGSLADPTVATDPVLNSILRFTGYLRVDQPGSLFLGVGSDDGSELRIQGTTVIFNDGIHGFPGPNDGPAEIGFEAPGLYEMEILFFESQVVGWGVEFYANAAGSGQAIPQRVLYRTTDVPEPGTMVLFALGAVGALGLWRRRRGR